MASFSALLYLDGKLYRVVWCQYAFRQPVDHRGRPRRKVLKGPIYVELWTGGVYPELTQWAADSHKTLSGRLVFARPDQPDSAFAHVWFTHATCTTHYERFDSSGQGLDGSLRLLLIISPEDMGRDAGSGAEWVPPLAREYAYSGRPVSAAAPAAPPVNPDIPPHLPAPIPNPSPDHQQVHLSAQEWQELIKGRWDRKNNKKFLQDHRQAEFHVAGNPFTYRTDANGKVVAVYDAQKSYNVTGTRKDAKGVPLTLNAEPTFAGTSYMYPATGNQKNIVVIKMAGSRKGDFRRANKAAGLTEVVKAQGLKADQPPKGYTWHHRDDFEANPNPPPYGTCTMELVKKEAHEDTFVHYGSCDQCNEYFGIKLYD